MDKKEISKNKIKRRIFIGASSVIIITICGSIGWKVIKTKDSGQDDIVQQSFLTGKELEKSYVTGSEEFEDLNHLEQLPSMLSLVGCGYSEENLAQYRVMSATGPVIEEEDKKNKENIVDQLYLFANEDGVEEKPEYGGNIDEEPKISYEKTTYEGKTAWRAKYTFKGEVKASEYIEEPDSFITNPGTEIGPDDYANFAKNKAFESIKEQYQKDYDIWNKWKDYYRKRATWHSNAINAGYFNAEQTNLPYSEMNQEYLSFWMKMACKLFEGVVGDSWGQLYTLLANITMTPDGELRTDLPNLFEAGITGTIDDVRDPDTGEIIEGSGGIGGGGSGGSGGGTGGGGTGGGGSGGGGSGGDGDNGNDSDQDTSVEEEDYETSGDGKDTVAAKLTGATLTAPPSGRYSKGQKIQIKVNFDKNICGTIEGSVIDKDSAPKLLIKINNETKDKNSIKPIEMEFESSGGSSISYSYIVKPEDNGVIELADGDNFDGVVYNKSGIPTIVKKIESLSGASDIIMDNIAPTVEKIETVSNEQTYEAGKEVKVKVTFNEAVYTAKNKVPIIDSTAPILMGTFGSGETRKFVFDTYSEQEKSITYKYTIVAEDKGKLKIDANNVFDGTREVCDASGTSIKIVKGVELTGNEVIANPTSARVDIDKDKIELDLKNATGSQEVTDNLKATLVGFADDVTVTWTSSNEDIVTVDQTGKVTAKKIGQAIITVKISKDGEIKAEAKCEVTIKDTTAGETKIQIAKPEVNLDLNGTKEETISAKVEKVDEKGNVTQTEQKITYISKDESIVKVENGKLVAVKPGETTIIVKSEDGTEEEIKVVVSNSSTTEIEPTAITTELPRVVIDPTKTKIFSLNCTIEPSNSNKSTKITYTSSNEKVATVDENGNVTIKGEGTAVIMATTENGKRSYTTVNSINSSTHDELNGAQTGDYNIDKVVDSTDLLTMLRHIAAVKSTSIAEKHQTWIVLDDKYYLLDVNNDGKVDTIDVLALQRHIATTKSEAIANEHKDWILK